MEIKITTPVLFLVFNRPEKTQQSFDAIRRAKPAKLYVAADAPRSNKKDDIILCQKVREIVLNVDWECEAHYLFHEINLGCTMAGKTAWDWFFSKEDRMIFIEDDGVPNMSFFYYCQNLLEKFKNDTRIAYIGGVNYGLKYGPASYFFSRECAATYSMATWKRVYDLYEYNLESYPVNFHKPNFKENFISEFSYKFYLRRFNSYFNSVISGKRENTYDIQMIYLAHKYNMYSIYPNVNMVSNIGLDFGGANNNLSPDDSFAKRFGNRPKFELNEIIHPKDFEVDASFEKKMFKQRSLHDKSWISVFFFEYVRRPLSKNKEMKMLYRKLFKRK